MNIWMKPIPDKRCPVKVGDNVIFAIAEEQKEDGMPTQAAQMRVGRVCDINENHRWFGVEYKIRGHKIREDFRFEDFGKAVQRYGK